MILNVRKNDMKCKLHLVKAFLLQCCFMKSFDHCDEKVYNCCHKQSQQVFNFLATAISSLVIVIENVVTGMSGSSLNIFQSTVMKNRWLIAVMKTC